MYAFQFSSYNKKVPNCEGGTILKRQISQKIFTSDFMLPDSKKIFDALKTIFWVFWSNILSVWSKKKKKNPKNSFHKKYQIARVAPSLNVKSRRKFLHLILCSQTAKKFLMPWKQYFECLIQNCLAY